MTSRNAGSLCLFRRSLVTIFSPEGFPRKSERTQSRDRSNYSPTRAICPIVRSRVESGSCFSALFFLFILVGIPHMTLAPIASSHPRVHYVHPTAGWLAFHESQISPAQFLKTDPCVSRGVISIPEDVRGREILALPCGVNRRIHCDATGGAERGRGCI